MMTITLLCVSLLSLFSSLVTSKEANLVLLKDAGEAVCLDGSPPGYYYRPGVGEGTSKWILYLKGGGWCYNETECLSRSRTELGTSKNWPPTATYNGFLSDSPDENPDFYTWNFVHINYCDGASFAGYKPKPITVQGTSIYFRGFKILQAVLDSVLKTGMSLATEVILTGSSAGGLATYLHADYVKSVLPSTVTKYAAIPDAGYFIDGLNINGELHARGLFTYVFHMQNCTGGVNQDCITAHTATNDTWKCFMAQYTYPHIKSRIFALNSQYDTWQLQNVAQLGCLPPKCTPEQMKELQKFYEQFKKASAPLIASQTNGAYLDSCLTHVQSISSKWTEVKVEGQTPAETFATWFYDRPTGKKILVDCPYPCNKSC